MCRSCVCNCESKQIMRLTTVLRVIMWGGTHTHAKVNTENNPSSPRPFTDPSPPLPFSARTPLLSLAPSLLFSLVSLLLSSLHISSSQMTLSTSYVSIIFFSFLLNLVLRSPFPLFPFHFRTFLILPLFSLFPLSLRPVSTSASPISSLSSYFRELSN